MSRAHKRYFSNMHTKQLRGFIGFLEADKPSSITAVKPNPKPVLHYIGTQSILASSYHE